MIKEAKREDCTVLAEPALLIWGGHTLSELRDEFAELTENDDSVCVIKYDGGKPVGFAQCSQRRDYVEGTKTSPVGYLEGVFVLEEYRLRGYAKEPVLRCEARAREKCCSEFASDCELINTESLKFHTALGFDEANRIICFTKKL